MNTCARMSCVSKNHRRPTLASVQRGVYTVVISGGHKDKPYRGVLGLSCGVGREGVCGRFKPLDVEEVGSVYYIYQTTSNTNTSLKGQQRKKRSFLLC